METTGSEVRVALKPLDKMVEDLRNQGVLFLDSPAVTWEMSAFFNRQLMHMAMTKLNSGDKTPIWICIMSPGGMVHAGLAIYDLILAVRKCGIEVNALGVGLVASMAAVIMQAADKRVVLPNTTIMIHEITYEIPCVKMREGEEIQAQMSKINRQVLGLIAIRAGIDTQNLVDKVCKTDVWLSPPEAKGYGKHGLIDEVIEELPIKFK